ncbi:MAG TPA: electron transfer flavoprotein subunit beta, partial [Armatimonadota bacterium]|nr:electron transfer flavoprotein subunit beta [Armatimonadota bacterium]
RGNMNAKRAEITVWKASDIDAPEYKIGLLGSPTQVIKIFSPPHREGGEKWTGESHELADKLANLLKEMEVV